MRRAAFYLICSILQHKLWEIQNEWWTNLAKRTQQHADLGDYRGFYKTIKAVYGPTHWAQSPLHSANGQVLFTDKASILSCWCGHFIPSLMLTVSSRTQQFSASPNNHSKQNWMNYPLWKKLPKPKTPLRRPPVPATLTTTSSWHLLLSGQAPHCPPGHLHLWGILQSQPQGETPEHLRSGKSVRVNGIPLELWKEGGPALHSKLH